MPIASSSIRTRDLRRRRPRVRRQVQARATIARARRALGGIRKATVLAVALTSLLLLFAAPEDAAGSDATDAQVASAPTSETQHDVIPRDNRTEGVAKAASHEAELAFGGLRENVLQSLPKIAVVCALLFAAWVLVRLARLILRRALGDWPRATGIVAITGVAVWAFALAVSVTVVAGDARAFLGSVGLVGLALSWALQTPIESFTGWLLNAFKGYYRVGDRVEVGEVYGDVHRIDVLTTTVWEIGSPFRPSFVRAEQPTGRLITFPNNQLLTGSVMNYTREFGYVWDELNIPIANESDVRYARDVLQRIAVEALGDEMKIAAEKYDRLLRRANLDSDVAEMPQVFVALDDSWTNLTIRYVVDARSRRRQKSDLVLRVLDELAKPEHRARIFPVLPRRQIQMLGIDGMPRDPYGGSHDAPDHAPDSSAAGGTV